MGLFDSIAKVAKIIDKVGDSIKEIESISNSVTNNTNATPKQSVETVEEIVLSDSSHVVQSDEYADDSEYTESFKINDSFKEADSHAGEVLMLNTYSPDSEYGEEGSVPYIAIQLDNAVYQAVEEYKSIGNFKGAIDLTPLNGNFYFKAKKEYYDNMMYFYGLDRCDGFWENNGLCLVYPKSYVGTENEKKLMSVLDQVAETFVEEKVK